MEKLALHKSVLLHSCDYFKTMFTAGFSEAAQQTVAINVAEGSSVAATKLVIRYLYTSDIVLDGDNVLEVLAAAGMLQLPNLTRTCVDFVKTSLDVHNVCALLTAGYQMNVVILMKICTKFVLRNGEAVLKSGEFINLPKDAMISIFSNDDLCATESTVLEAAIVWAKSSIGSCNNGCLAGNGVSDLLPYVRLDEMDSESLCNCVKETGLFSTEKILAAMATMTRRLKKRTRRVFDDIVNFTELRQDAAKTTSLRVG
jgi:hypothetical protein